ncbi:MAG: exopolyphosphatase, partial [Rhodospirillales bacterium]|nr:exopolyphosphatase [Rhodospirillales bacterium]
PLGVLRLAEAAEDDRPKAIALVDRHLGKINWVTSAAGQALYTTGGAWRAIARICIAQTAHPLSVLDNYTLDRRDALRLIDLISRQSRKSLEKIPGISKKRLPTLPLAALLLERVLLATQPARLVFSVYGMREGQFYKVMPSYLREQDALIGACTEMARKAGRFPEHSGEIMQWMAPLFVPRETPPQRRLRQAACLLSDVFWNEHPDYRAEQGFLRVLRLPFMGLGHRDRAALALTVYTRYGGPDDGGTVAECRSLLNDEDMRRARAIGWALRLAHTVSGAAPGLLGLTRLVIEGKSLVLVLPATDPTFQPELGERRYDKLAKAAGCDALVVRRV